MSSAKTPTSKWSNAVPVNSSITIPNSSVTIPVNGSSGVTYTTATTDATWISNPCYTKQPRVSITDKDIEIDGLSLRETMLAIKKELMIPERLNRNKQLEQEFAELEQAAERYRELEEKFLEQKAMWNTLKNTDLK